MKIAVCGIGYVGLSLAVLLSQENEVVTLNIHKSKTDMINNRVSPIRDAEIEQYLKEKKLNLRSTIDWRDALSDAEYIIIATPTNYDEKTNYFDTSAVDDVIKKTLEVNKKGTIVIKSTIPVGYVNSIKEKYNIENIFFSPEFLREGHALYDNLHPSRIIIGSNTSEAKTFAKMLSDAALDKDVPVKYVGSTEAEAIKLFANTYLAMRIAYFNELDTYAEIKGLNTKEIIDGVCLDPRIGNHYNNPSFGFGGYCLPKDTKQLLANFGDIPQSMFSAVVTANMTRKKHIVDEILSKKPKTVGVYRLIMKSGSDNFRSSAIQDIIFMLRKNNIRVLIFEPTISEDTFGDFPIYHDFSIFQKESDIILANRFDQVLDSVKEKVYTRDIFSRD